MRDKTYLLDACGDGAKQTKHRGEKTFCKEHDRRFVLIIILIASARYAQAPPISWVHQLFVLRTARKYIGREEVVNFEAMILRSDVCLRKH